MKRAVDLRDSVPCQVHDYISWTSHVAAIITSVDQNIANNIIVMMPLITLFSDLAYFKGLTQPGSGTMKNELVSKFSGGSTPYGREGRSPHVHDQKNPTT